MTVRTDPEYARQKLALSNKSGDKPKAVVVISGGLDSTTLLYDAMQDYDVVHAVSFNYGQRHKKELHYASVTCSKLDVRHDIVDLRNLTELISNSSLTSDAPVPEGHYAEETMKQTVVPNRNMIMISIAGGVAVNDGANALLVGVHSGDHFVYPDCRTGFVGAASLALYLGNEGFGNLWRAPLVAPYIHKSKADIAYKALQLRVPFEETWSCYVGGDIHCGRCGTCVERLEAINEAVIRFEREDPGGLTYAVGEMNAGSLYDHTQYADTEFWKEATK
jgi:7-cyano-7-deazaguanine synthase